MSLAGIGMKGTLRLTALYLSSRFSPCSPTCSTQTATFTSLRFLRPLVFPLFEYALPVKTMLRFESPRGFDQPTQDDSKEELLLVAEFKDEWVAERLLSFAPKFVQQA